MKKEHQVVEDEHQVENEQQLSYTEGSNCASLFMADIANTPLQNPYLFSEVGEEAGDGAQHMVCWLTTCPSHSTFLVTEQCDIGKLSW